jgi:hypothetical protein
VSVHIFAVQLMATKKHRHALALNGTAPQDRHLHLRAGKHSEKPA